MVAILLQFADKIVEKIENNKEVKKWKFRLPKDQGFIDKYFALNFIFLNSEYWGVCYDCRFPDVVRRQELMSQAKQKQLKAMTSAAEFKAPKKEPADPAKKTTRIRRGSRKDSCSSDSGSDTKK